MADPKPSYSWRDMRGRRHQSKLFKNDAGRLVWAKDYIAYFERLYAVEKNPLLAWQAYHIWRGFAFELDPPEWILGYFDTVETNLSLLAGDQPGEKQIAPGVVAAVGFVPGGAEQTFKRYLARLRHDTDFLLTLHEKSGAYNPFQSPLVPAYKTYSEAYVICQQLASSPGTDKDPSICAIAEARTPRQRHAATLRAVAEAHKVHPKTIARALKKYPPETDTK